jgi:hypothetical protein
MFESGKVWYGIDGQPIQAHGGGILYNQGTYYWFGENKDAETRAGHTDVVGISCYSSRDLSSWHNEGIVLSAIRADPQHDLHVSKVVERPKVIDNAKTRMYVMWMHIDNADYSYARAGIATSTSPTGPYYYLGSVRPCGTDSRDMTLFQDDDESAYLIFSSEWHRNITIELLTNDYLSPTDAFIKTLSHPRHPEGREAPAVFKHEGTYFLITSACTGWEPNAAEYAIASSLLGEWTTQGNPCVGYDAATTFHAQSTHVLPVIGKENAYIFMADRWNSDNLKDSRYIWLPLEIQGKKLVIRWQVSWDLSMFDSSSSSM